ncbi:hypothetical protein N7540_013042 [Penicillium herquei]|nr:hypothetical protein N7540_013042 [Penicillium herquei]
MNWDIQKSKELLDNDEVAVTSMKTLQSYVSWLRRERLIGRNASDVYKDGNPDSVQFTISSLLFENIRSGCGVKSFF